MKSFVITLVLLAFQVSAACGQESSSPWWNPLGKSTSSGSDVQQSSFFDKKSSAPSFKLPKMNLNWLPSMGTKKSKGPSTMTKMTRSTKKMWNSTVDFLNPFESPAPQKQQPWYQPQTMKKSSKGGGWDWLWPKEEKFEEPTDVRDFITLPRPKF